jgi:membrane-bound lytic murein transglycosylase B
MRLKNNLISLFLILSIFLGGAQFSFASAELDRAQAEKARLEAELSGLEQEIAQKQKELNAQKGQSTSLSRDIAILSTQIAKSKLDIKAKNLQITKLGGEITQKNSTIQSLTEKIELEKESLAQLLRKNREIDEISMVSLLISKNSLSDVYGDVDAFNSLKRAIRKSVDEIRGDRTQTEAEKKALEEKKNQAIDVKVALEMAKKQVEINEKDKQQLLSISKSKESEYQKLLADKAKRRAEILAVLFNLRDTGAIPFGKALEYANWAEKVSGIRPAFLLAIITQESNLGTDQGSCYLTDQSTGAGVSSRSGKAYPNVMKPTRDVGPFIEITTGAGRDPYKTLVSCPIASAGASSWGGAMGPAQFIPSTWMGMKSKIAKAIGKTNPDPWDAPDAFMASALFLKELGASAGGYTAEIKAACKYYGTGGTACTYGKQVMAKAVKIQTTMIDPLQN